MSSQQDECDGSINNEPLIDGLLIKEGVSEKQKQVVHSVAPGMTPASGMSALNRYAGWNERLLMADQGNVVSSCSGYCDRQPMSAPRVPKLGSMTTKVPSRHLLPL